MNTLNLIKLSIGLAAISLVGAPVTAYAQSPANNMKMEKTMKHETSAFKGVEVNGGKAIHWTENGKQFLMASADFKLPKSPAPHWQVVDSKGNVYLLKQFNIVGSKSNLKIEVPSYVKDIAKVQVWCSFAEVLLGEAKFAKPVMAP